jgi:hypothetical protein
MSAPTEETFPFDDSDLKAVFTEILAKWKKFGEVTIDFDTKDIMWHRRKCEHDFMVVTRCLCKNCGKEERPLCENGNHHWIEIGPRNEVGNKRSKQMYMCSACGRDKDEAEFDTKDE